MLDQDAPGARSRLVALALGVWVVLADAALKLIARLGGCEPPGLVAGIEPPLQTLRAIWQVPEGCEGSAMAGPSVRLQPALHDGALLGLGSGSLGAVAGQLYALALLFAATAATIVVMRWSGRSAGDGGALALVWSGALLAALPRLLGDGRGLAELSLFGLATGIAELALLWGLAWLAARAVAEIRR